MINLGRKPKVSIEEVAKLWDQGLSERQIAKKYNISQPAVHRKLKKAEKKGLLVRILINPKTIDKTTKVISKKQKTTDIKVIENISTKLEQLLEGEIPSKNGKNGETVEGLKHLQKKGLKVTIDHVELLEGIIKNLKKLVEKEIEA